MTGRSARWRLRLFKFELAVVHLAGIEHQTTDALSCPTTTGKPHALIESDLPVALLELSIVNILNILPIADVASLSDDANIRMIVYVAEDNIAEKRGAVSMQRKLLQHQTTDVFCEVAT